MKHFHERQRQFLKEGQFVKSSTNTKSSISHCRWLITGWRSSTFGICFYLVRISPRSITSRSKWHSAATVVISHLLHRPPPCLCRSVAEYLSSVPLAKADSELSNCTLIPHSPSQHDQQHDKEIKYILRGTLDAVYFNARHSITTIWRNALK